MKNRAIHSLCSIILFMLVFNSPVSAQFPGMGGGPGGPGNNGGMPKDTKSGQQGNNNTGNNGGLNLGNLQNMMQTMKMNIGHIFGKVVDAKTKKGVDYASVALYTLKGDSLVGGQLTENNGDFSLDNITLGGYKIKVSYLGYKTVEQKVIVTPNNAEQDIGDIAIEEDSKNLKEVTVTAERPAIELKPDRKVFNVEKDISARGGTGVDVMKNIPGVSTDADGNVTLRNNTPQIYVDGKPTTLTLEQIPADQIDRVEVITNPSSKFEAAATGGIINVVLKKNLKPGYNGMATMALGTNTQYNGMALINVREKKFGFMVTYNINSNTNRTNSYTDRTNLNNGDINSYFHQTDNVTAKRTFQFARVGLDYNINNRNTMSLSENMSFGKFTTGDAQNFTISDSAHNGVANGTRQSDQGVSFRNFTTDLSFHHTYPKPDKEWTLDLNYNRSKGSTDYLYTTNNYLPNGSLLANNPELQKNDGGQHTDMVTAQWDFVDPLPKNMKLEFGVRSNYQLQYSQLNVQNFDYPSNTYLRDTTLSNNYRIDNLVNAAYITFSHSVKQFSYQIGLRFEESYYKGTLLDHNNLSFSYQFPSAVSNLYNLLFPSLNLSQKFGDKHELQFNITRKIRRPNFFQLSPFIFSSDKFNYSIGNPNLQPEFNNKAELNYDLTIPKFTWLSSLYGTYNQLPITQYTYTKPDDSLVLINSFINGNSSFSYGWENTFKISPVKGLDLTADGNVFYTSISSTVANALISNSGISWTVKGMISYKFPLGIVGQVNGTYEAPRVIPQGHTLPMYFFDISVSKDLGIVSFNLTVSDVLNSRTHGTYYDTPTYIQTSTRRRDMRFAKLGITIRFGKMDSSIFKLKKQMKKDMPANGDDMGF
jgi:hypothetical protein